MVPALTPNSRARSPSLGNGGTGFRIGRWRCGRLGIAQLQMDWPRRELARVTWKGSRISNKLGRNCVPATMTALARARPLGGRGGQHLRSNVGFGAPDATAAVPVSNRRKTANAVLRRCRAMSTLAFEFVHSRMRARAACVKECERSGKSRSRTRISMRSLATNASMSVRISALARR